MPTKIKQTVKKIIREYFFLLFEKIGLHLLPVHFYSPVPDTQNLKKTINRWHKKYNLNDIDINIKKQTELVNKLSQFSNDFNKLPLYKTILARKYGEGFNQYDCATLYKMIRYLKPTNIIEIGAGTSTYYIYNGMKKNKHGEIKSIEPYPTKNLKHYTKEKNIKLIQSQIQEINVNYFKKLKTNDILFIDSSHTVKIDSDVNYLILEILPQLNSGVIIHIHDIPFPFMTLEPNKWIFNKHLFWTEPVAIKAFLSGNKDYEIMLCSSYIYYQNNKKQNNNAPSSLWLRKKII